MYVMIIIIFFLEQAGEVCINTCRIWIELYKLISNLMTIVRYCVEYLHEFGYDRLELYLAA